VNPDQLPIADSASDPVVLTAQTLDRLDPFGLVKTGDTRFNRVVVVLTLLCDEVQFLKETAARKLYDQLALFGHTKVGG